MNSEFKTGEGPSGVVRACLILFTIIFLLSDGVHADLFVIFLQGSKILTSFREFSLFHTLTDVPVNKSSLGVHEIELVVKWKMVIEDVNQFQLTLGHCTVLAEIKLVKDCLRVGHGVTWCVRARQK